MVIRVRILWGNRSSQAGSQRKSATAFSTAARRARLALPLGLDMTNYRAIAEVMNGARCGRHAATSALVGMDHRRTITVVTDMQKVCISKSMTIPAAQQQFTYRCSCGCIRAVVHAPRAFRAGARLFLFSTRAGEYTRASSLTLHVHHCCLQVCRVHKTGYASGQWQTCRYACATRRASLTSAPSRSHANYRT